MSPSSGWIGFDNQSIISTENSLTASVELPVPLEDFVGDLTNDAPGPSNTLAVSSASTLVHRPTRQRRTGTSRLRRPGMDLDITPGTLVEVDPDTFSQGIKYDRDTFQALFPNASSVLGDARMHVRNQINLQGIGGRKALKQAASIHVTEKVTLLIALQKPIEKGQLPCAI